MTQTRKEQKNHSQNGKKHYWSLESHTVPSQPGVGRVPDKICVQHNFSPFCQQKKTGNQHGKKENKEKHAKGNCQWEQSFVMLCISSWNSRRSDIPCPGSELSNWLQTSLHVASLHNLTTSETSDCPLIIWTIQFTPWLTVR